MFKEIYVCFAGFVKVLRSFSMTDYASLRNVSMAHKIQNLENTVAERESRIVSRYCNIIVHHQGTFCL